MNKIEVAVLHEAHTSPAGMMMFLAKLTQRGHSIKNMDDLMRLYENTIASHPGADKVVAMPHSTIKRFTPITVAVVGASRRFLAQARTHQVGITYVSASLQYSDYSGEADFVVPYPIMEHDAQNIKAVGLASAVDTYLNSCKRSMDVYTQLAKLTDNDTAGYAAPQGLRNILIIQANHESWQHFIRLRACNRNTNETQYVTLRIWEELLKTEDGMDMFQFAGPDCVYGKCREGRMSCGTILNPEEVPHTNLPGVIIEERWPLLNGDRES